MKEEEFWKLMSPLLGALLAGIVGLIGICLSKLKCFCRHVDEEEGCKWGCGFTNKSILGDDNGTEVKTIKVNGVDMLYLEKRGDFITSETSDDNC